MDFFTRAVNAYGIRVLVLDQVEFGLRIVLALLAVGAIALLAIKRRLPPYFIFFGFFLLWLFSRNLILGEYAGWPLVAGSIAVLLLFFSRYWNRDFLLEMLILPTSYLFMSLSFAMFFPEKGFLPGDGSDYYGEPLVGRLSGIAPHPNIFAPMMALGLLVVVARGKLSLWSGFLAVLFGVTLLWSAADGAVLATVASLALTVFLRDWTRPKGLKARWKSWLAGMGLLGTAVWSAFVLAGSGLGGFTTGRTTIWRSFWESALQAGWFGLGSEHGYAEPQYFDDVAARFQNPHNVWLSNQVFTGYLGTGLFLLFWVTLIMSVAKQQMSSEKILAASLGTFLLINGLVEFHFLPENEIFFLMYAVTIAATARTARPHFLEGRYNA